MDQEIKESLQDSSIVFGHKVCQTRDANWLCIKELYQKFHRPNIYDIGGTYIEDVADYWFRFKTDQVGDIFLLHLFISNRQESSFTVGVSYNGTFTCDEKHGACHMSKTIKRYEFKNRKSNSQNYITTYDFKSFDLQSMKDKLFYINVSFPRIEVKSQKIIEDVKFSHDFSGLLLDPIASDFTIESEDGERFKVHKILLSAHSDYFKAMLKEDTAESQNNFVKLVGVNKDDLKCILEFTYCGTIKDLGNANWANLLMLSDLYNLKGLFELSEHALSQHLNIDNALEILSLADLYNSQCLKMATVKFIAMNTEVLKSSTFKELNPDLVREICLKISDN